MSYEDFVIEKDGIYCIDWEKLTAYLHKQFRTNKQRQEWARRMQEWVSNKNKKY